MQISFYYGTTGGSKQHKISRDELPNHAHRIPAKIASDQNYQNGNFTIEWGYQGQYYDNAWKSRYSDVGMPDVKNYPFSLMDPYISVYMWKRIR